MRWLLDFAYLAAALLTAPIWITRMVRTGRIHTDWRGRFGRGLALGPKNGPRILIHAVSVGEVNAIRSLVEQLANSPSSGGTQFDVVVSTTTDTGFARATALWPREAGAGAGAAGGAAGGVLVVRYPFDFSLAADRFLDRIHPDAVALVELEVWPNFTGACKRRGIPVAVINGRLTERSLRRYRRLGGLVRRSFGRLALVLAQNEAYAQRFRAMGVPAERIEIAGNLKWDTAQIADHVPGAAELAEAMGIDRARPLIVAGSTAPGEHELLLAARPAGCQLLCAPRKPEWFEQAAAALPGCVRRTGNSAACAIASAPISNDECEPTSGELFLLDTIGELRQAYALADLVVIGRSFGNLHGSDMMEPIALDKATVIGPAIADFQETMDALRAGDGIVQITADELPQTLRRLLDDPDRRAELAANGRAVIRAHQGATARIASRLAALAMAARAAESQR